MDKDRDAKTLASFDQSKPKCNPFIDTPIPSVLASATTPPFMPGQLPRPSIIVSSVRPGQRPQQLPINMVHNMFGARLGQAPASRVNSRPTSPACSKVGSTMGAPPCSIRASGGAPAAGSPEKWPAEMARNPSRNTAGTSRHSSTTPAASAR